MVKNPQAVNKLNNQAKIYYCDIGNIGNFIKTQEKLDKIKDAGSFNNLPLTVIHPNEYGDWLNPRQDYPDNFISLADKNKKKEDPQAKTFFVTFSQGVLTGRDPWCVNFSLDELRTNIKNTIDSYNSELERFRQAKLNDGQLVKADDFINRDSTQFHWDRKNLDDARRDKDYLEPTENEFRKTIYRPFCGEWLYFNRQLDARVYQMPKLFPTPDAENLVIAFPGKGHKKQFSVFMMKDIANYHSISEGQCLPLYFYKTKEKDFFISDDRVRGYERVDAISDFIFKKARGQYHDDTITKEDIFYYVYGFLHHPAYREKFKDTFSRELLRIPLVASLADFRAFSEAGRELGRLHTEYETVPPYPGVSVTGTEAGDFSVTKMRYGKKGKETLRDTIIYNNHITISDIPLEAYDYVVNGKSAIHWILDLYQVNIDKDTKIKNDPNDWAREHEKPRYILDLLLSVINVSMQTLEIMENLPPLELSEGAKRE